MEETVFCLFGLSSENWKNLLLRKDELKVVIFFLGRFYYFVCSSRIPIKKQKGW